MAAAGVSLLTYIITSLAILITYFVFFSSKYQYTTTPTYLRPLLTLLVLWHTLDILYQLLLNPPTNLFTGLDVPLSYPADSIRSLLLMYADDPASGLPSGIERVLTRLESAAMRTLYVRFGHDAIAMCEYCSDLNDFALFLAPRWLWDYAREILIIGVLTLKGSRHTHLRTYSVAALCAAALFEVYIVYTTPIRIPRDNEYAGDIWSWVERLYGGHGVVQWHDALILCRRLVFLVLPILVHFVLKPLTAMGEAVQSSPENLAFNALQGLREKIQLLRLTRGAIARHPELRAAAEDYWAAERQEGEWVREDEDVRRIAKSVGMGFDEASKEDVDDSSSPALADGPLLQNAKTAAQKLLDGYRPSSYWAIPQDSPTTTKSS
ncbi:hypothetical protein BDP27DRAFT_1293750 [Rhodocollybia butyracea]|uniref:Uncharacterized protein n=1 Tax=Rhodocollybia butyracea TaxID=206335 RepID=A0A9P5PU88_9AGAR|nr:hypothetical protein BDP27DRAFT_1293750 [Rhodocollybia butyracea]